MVGSYVPAMDEDVATMRLDISLWCLLLSVFGIMKSQWSPTPRLHWGASGWPFLKERVAGSKQGSHANSHLRLMMLYHL